MFQKLSPALKVAISFLGVISIGSLLLKLPFALERGAALSWINSFFVATSATCVTGLSPINISSTFSYFGEAVILLLMQIGGTGVMVLSSYFYLSLGRNVSMRQKMHLQETFAGDYDVNWRTLVRAVVHYVLVIEGVCALILALLFLPHHSVAESIYYGIFHSVSAFCNAGLALFSNSFVSFKSNTAINVVMMFLIVSGGMGFFVMWEVKEWFKHRKSRFRISLHTKVVLLTSLFLIAGGAVAIWLLEMNNPEMGSTYIGRFLPAFFQSVTCRTAGFNSVDFSFLGNDTVLLMMFLMFIGASPGSCGGGIKTTTTAVIVALFWSRLRGRSKTNIFKRTLSADLIGRSLGIAVAAALILIVGNVLLMMTDISHGHYERGRFVEFLFESISALGTVGLSLGVTAKLSGVGKTVIMLLMFFGRVGVMAMFLQAVSSQKDTSIEYAGEGVMIG
ncbi:MAG: hypothetical protein JNL74_16825 [Fibrobacteres bacterium]|nr:hypothetical protein [Fibrobacterota bacterium]